jgi:hypothetical protein
MPKSMHRQIPLEDQRFPPIKTIQEVAHDCVFRLMCAFQVVQTSIRKRETEAIDSLLQLCHDC